MSETDKPNTTTLVEERRRTASSVPDELLSRIIEETTRQVQAQAARPSPFDLRTFEEIENFAERVTRSGLCPKDFKGKADDAIVAILKGKEIGLPPMASLESIAVINGRPSIWGEAIPGLCMATGLVQDVVERYEGEGEDFSAVCVVTRRGYSPREGRFSYADVAKAGLKNVHLQYPKDMIMWRARHRAWHGAFPDVLKGLGTAEIEQELASVPEWNMPAPERAWFIPKPKPDGDQWDDRWFDSAARQLHQESSAWKWLDLLVTLLHAAPTLRDVDEVEALASVAKVTASAPDEAKGIIERSFADARERLNPAPTAEKPSIAAAADPKAANPPAKAKQANARQPDAPHTAPASQTAQQGAEQDTTAQAQQGAQDEAETFEYYLLDAGGDPIGDDTHTDPAKWADLFMAEWIKSANRIGLVEQNADAIEDARAQSQEATKLLADLDEPEVDEAADAAHGAEAPKIPVIVPTVERGKANYGAWLRDLKGSLAGTTDATFYDWVAAQKPEIDKAPQQSRLLAVKAIVERAHALKLNPPQGFEPQPQEDKDERTVRAIEEGFAGQADAHGVRAYSNQATVTTPLKRFEQEGKDALVQRIRAAATKRLEELQAPA